MGQLEKYGLYVLCLVICLILGVAIWGGDGTGNGDVPNERHTSIEPPTQQAPPQVGVRSEPRIDPGDLEGLREIKPRDADRRAEASPVAATTTLRTYKVKPNEVLGEIARRELGSTKYVQDIMELNPGLDANRMPAGMEIKLPAREGLASRTEKVAEKSTDPTPAKKSPPKDESRSNTTKSYVVKSGDSPASISKRVYGDESYKDDIMKLNHITDPAKLQVGDELKLPARK